MAVPRSEASTPGGVFSLAATDAYRRWRDARQAAAADPALREPVDVACLATPTPAVLAAVRARCAAQGYAFYRCPSAVGPADLAAFGRQLGLTRVDPGPVAASGRTARPPVVRVVQARPGWDGDGRGEGSRPPRQPADRAAQPAVEYVPFTRRALNWHTDGYYNAREHLVCGLLMHCREPAEQGGTSHFLDPALAYIALRERDPELVRALMESDALTIPANVVDGVSVRPARSGPVFSLSPDGRHLHTRYTIRSVHVQWSDRAAGAASVLRAYLTGPRCPAVSRRLEAGEGVICNNVLHARDAFEDGPGGRRAILRARYLDRVSPEPPRRRAQGPRTPGAVPADEARVEVSAQPRGRCST